MIAPLSCDSSIHSITLSYPLLVFIPIIKILPSFGSNDVVSKSNTSLVTSSYSSYPLNSRFSFDMRYCSTGGSMSILSLTLSPHGSNCPSLKNCINSLYPLTDLTINVKPFSNLSLPFVSNFSIIIPYLDIASFCNALEF